MNERIKQIAEQAGVAVWGDAVYRYNPKDILDSTIMEKFAKLIVQECNRYACSAWEHGPLLGRDLLIHFGVEE